MSPTKVLILNQPFVSDTGGGITMSNLFSGWESDNLAVACSGYLLTDDIDPQKCNNYYQLGREERKWIFPLNLVSRKYPSGEIKFTNKTKERVVKNSSKSKSRTTFVQRFVEPLFDYLGFTHFMDKTILSPKFKQWMDDFDPDVIYAQCSSRDTILFCIAVQEYLGKPMAYHMMDDWPALFGRKGFMKKYWENKVDKEFRILLNRSHLLMAICDYMGEEYLRRYGKEFATYHNPIEIDFWRKGQRTNYDIDKSPTILYAGRIGLGIDNSLKTIAKAVDKVNNELDMSIEFAIQANEAPSWIESFSCTKYQHFVDYDELPMVFGGADFMILPYDFDPKGLTFIKYSMPTKASEYMVSGTPVIVFAPNDTALVQYAKNHDWAAIVTENDTDLLAETIKNLMKSKSLREQLARSAKKLAENRHSKDLVSEDFQHKLLQLADKDIYNPENTLG